MKDCTNRLQVLERFFCVKSIPTFEQFKTKWAEADPLSRSVIAALAESGDFEAVRKPWEKYMFAVRGYLLQMGEIDPDAKSLRQIAAEMLVSPSGLPTDRVKNLFCCETGYQTPKLDTRAAVFQEDKILLQNRVKKLSRGWVLVILCVVCLGFGLSMEPIFNWGPWMDIVSIYIIPIGATIGAVS